MFRDRTRLEENTAGILTDEVREFTRLLKRVETLNPLHIEPDGPRPPETYPWGV